VGLSSDARSFLRRRFCPRDERGGEEKEVGRRRLRGRGGGGGELLRRFMQKALRREEGVDVGSLYPQRLP